MKDIIKIKNKEQDEIILASENIIGIQHEYTEIKFLTKSGTFWIDFSTPDKAKNIYEKIKNNLLKDKEVTELS